MKKNSNSQKQPGIFNVNDYLSTGIDKNEILELKDAFDLLDDKATGKILVSGISVGYLDLINLLETYGAHSRCHSLQICVSQSTSPGKQIDFNAFLNIFTAYFYTQKSKSNYKKIFKLFDDENMGCISAKNLRRVIKELNIQLDESEIQEMIDRADTNNDGVVNQQQFYEIMTKIAMRE